MSDRVRKRKQKSSTARRHTRATIASVFGRKMVKCSRCKSRNLECLLSENSDFCDGCLRSNVPCDAFGYDDAAVRRLVAQKTLLDQEEQKASDAMREANRALLSALAKVERLRTQRQSLERKALAMFDQEGEVLREQERREAAAALPTPPLLNLQTPSALPDSLFNSPFPFE